MMNSHKYVQEVLIKHAYDFEKNRSTRIVARKFIGNGLITGDNDFHKKQRKLVSPAFHQQSITSYADIMVRYTKDMLEKWRKNCIIDINQELTELPIRIIGKVIFDVDLQKQTKKLEKMFLTAIRLVVEAVNSPLYIPYILPTPRNMRICKALSYLHETIDRIVRERRQSGEHRNDLLSMLLYSTDDDGNPMSDVQLHDEMLELLIAGHETITNALVWTLYMLTQHPLVYSRLCQEVDIALNKDLPGSIDLVSLPYTLQVFKETLRLYPPVYLIGRQAKHNLIIGDHFVPEGVGVLISPYVIHRRSDYFPNPEHFDPNRFELAMERSRPRYAYVPFGAGPHVCIGNHLALMEGHLILATLARYVTFELVAGQKIEVEPLVTLRPKGGIRMIVRQR